MSFSMQPERNELDERLDNETRAGQQ